MNETTLSTRNTAILALYCLICLLLGYVYVGSIRAGVRPTLVIHGLALLFLVAALSLGDLRSRLTFAMILVIPLAIDYHFVRYALEHGTPVFQDAIVISLVDCLLAVLLLYWLASASIEGTHGSLTVGHPIGTLLLVWIAYSLVAGSLKAARPVYAYFEVIALLQGFLLYFYLANNVNSRRDIRVIIYALFVAQSVESLYLLFQYITGLNYTTKGVFIEPVRDVVGFRSAGFTGGEVGSTQMISFVASLVLAYYFGLADRFRRFLAAAMLLIFMIGILCAQTRAAFAAVLVGSVVILALGTWRGWIAPRRLLKFVSIGLLFLLLVSPVVYQRFQKGEGSWGEVRLPLMRTATDMWMDNLWFGVGASNYNFNMERYLPVRLRHTWKWAVHQEFLLHLAERGIIGALLYYLIWLIVCAKLWRLSSSSDRWISVISVGILAGMIGSLPMRLVHPYHSMLTYSFSCVMLALTVAMERMERKRTESVTAASSEFGGVPALDRFPSRLPRL
jgi:hypothetical protein